MSRSASSARLYLPGSGKLEIWRDGVFVGNWTDPAPLQNGSYLSLRTNTTDASFDDLAVEQETRYYYGSCGILMVVHRQVRLREPSVSDRADRALRDHTSAASGISDG